MDYTNYIDGSARKPSHTRSRSTWRQHLALCAVIAGMLTACNSDDGSGGSGGSAGQGGASGTMAATGGASGTMAGTSGTGGTSGTSAGEGGTSGTAGSGGTGGMPLRPPNPRTDLGAPDGVVCVDAEMAETTCATGQKCCPANLSSDNPTACEAPAGDCMGTCHEGTTHCAEAACDGPEDCPGQLCCLRLSSCNLEGKPCSGEYNIVSCQDRCENTEAIPGQVVCKDPRDCLYEASECLLRNEAPYTKTCR